MKNWMKIFLAASATLCLSVSLFAGCSPAEKNNGASVDVEKWQETVVASGESGSLTLVDYMYFLRSTQQGVEQSVIDSGSHTAETLHEYWTTAGDDGTIPEETLKTQSLVDAKYFTTLYQLALDAGTTVPPDVAAESIEIVDSELETMNGEAEDAEKAFFETYGVSSEQMKSIYSKIDHINQYLYDMTDVSDEDVRAAFDADSSLYDQVRVRHVLILSDDTMTEEQRTAAKEKADDLLAQLQGGADIGALAAEHSEDPGSKENNGEYTFGRNQMVPEFESWAFSAQIGDQGIVETSYGYHIMEMMENLPGDFEYVKDYLKQQMGDEVAYALMGEAMATANDDSKWTVDQTVVDGIVVSVPK